ncbi:MAG: flagellar biosynthetic protein FliO [Lachnospiraceae bacterium]|nr:flagellar biosynthetic protein FliO [Lachnospiraceae bacterium]
MQLLGVLLIFIFVLAITFVTTKWIAGYQKSNSYNKNLRVVETLRLTQNKYIQIVEAGEVYLVVGIGKDEITMLTTLTEEQLKSLDVYDMTKQTKAGENFQEILNKLKERLPRK